jgi:hypothetical protein
MLFHGKIRVARTNQKAPAAAEAVIFLPGGKLGLYLGRLGLRGVGFGGVRLRILAAEALHATGGVDHLLLAGEKRVAVGTDFHVDVALMGGTSLKSVPTGALHTDGFVIGMNPLLWHWNKTFLKKR